MEDWKNYPLRACTIDLTENCNLRCTYCFTWGKTPRTLPESLGKKIVDFFYEYFDRKGPAEISFWGGEPLLEFDLLKRLVKYAEKKFKGNVVFGGTTNGTLLDEDKLKFLTDHRCKMLISIDGTKEHHNKFRIYPSGEGSWDDVFRKIPLVLKYWPDARIRFSLTPLLIPDLITAIDKLHKEGVNYFIFSPVYECDWTKDNFKRLKKTMRQLVSYLSRHKDIMIPHFYDDIYGTKQIYPCGAGTTYVAFGVDGTITPCHRFRKYGSQYDEWNRKICIGNVKKGFFPLRQIFIDFPYVRQKQCKDCKAYTLCKGGCYAINYEMSGSIFGIVDKLCTYENIRFHTAKMVQKKIKNQHEISTTSCICYNACYMENTPIEVRNVDTNADFACMCYNTTYQGDPNAQYRPLIKMQ